MKAIRKLGIDIWIAMVVLISVLGRTEIFVNATDNSSDMTAETSDMIAKLDGVTTENSDISGFTSGDNIYADPDDQTIHVIIENPQYENNPNQDNNGNDSSDNGSDNNSTENTADTDNNSSTPSYSDDSYSGDSYSGDSYSSDSYTGSSGGSSSSEKIFHKPQLLLEESNFSGQSLNAGTTFELSITFQNKSRSQNIFGLKISPSTETTGIEFDKNSFYVRRLTPGESVTINPVMTIAKDAQPGQVTLSFSLEYEDSKATAATGTEILTFHIVQPVRAELEISDIPSVLYTMDTIEIPVRVLNLGKDKICNVMVTLAAQGLTSKETVFLGNIDAGTAAEGSMKVYVKGLTDPSDEAHVLPGQTAGVFTLTYEDSSGQTYETTTDFQSEIKESKIQSLTVEEESEETNSWWYSVLAVAAFLLISLILFLARALHRKNILLEEARKSVRFSDIDKQIPSVK